MMILIWLICIIYNINIESGQPIHSRAYFPHWWHFSPNAFGMQSWWYGFLFRIIYSLLIVLSQKLHVKHFLCNVLPYHGQIAEFLKKCKTSAPWVKSLDALISISPIIRWPFSWNITHSRVFSPHLKQVIPLSCIFWWL